MSTKTVAACLAALCCAVLLATTTASTADELQNFAAQDYLVTLTDANFGKFVLGKNRPYHLFVLFNAKHPRHQCEPCEGFEHELALLSSSYAGLERGDDDVPVYFAVADYDANQQSFKAYQLKSVPVLTYFSPTTASAHKKGAMPPPYQGELTAEGAAGFLRERTGVDVEIYRSPLPGLIMLGMFVTFVGVMWWNFSSAILALAERVRNNRTIWMLACVGVYFISVSGVLYDIIRGVPAFSFDPKTRQAIFIHPQSGTQFAVEGFFIGGLNIACALAVIVLVKFSRNRSEQSSRNTWAIGCIATFFILYLQIINLYRFKNPWYRVL